MLKRLIIISVIQALAFLAVFSQDTISLAWCLDKTAQNHPRSGNSEIIESIREKKIENIRSGNLPQAELNGKASYQSDVTKLDINIPIPGIVVPESPRDQYKISLDIVQSIYDGGFSKNRQFVENVSGKMDQSQLELDIRTSKMQVKDLYYVLLVIQKNIDVLDVSVSQLDENRAVVETGIRNGVLLGSDMDLLDVEIIKMKQSMSELENTRRSGLEVLSYKLGEEINPGTFLQPTSFMVPAKDSLQRLEQELFDLQLQQLDLNMSVLKSRTLPKFFAFGQFGYGNPALNMLQDEFKTYYVLGAGIKWTIWDWKINSRDREVLGLQQDIVESRKLQFETEINSALISQKAAIKNHQENLDAYGKILVLRSRISETARLQLGEGIIKTLDYLNVQNQETIARIQFENEKTLLQQSIARYLEIIGEL